MAERSGRIERAERILLLGHEKEHGLNLVRILAKAGHEPLADTWAEFNPRAYGRKRPSLLLADADAEDAAPFGDFCVALRKVWGESYPLLVTGRSTRFADVAKLLDAGATDFVAKNAKEEFVAGKIAKWLAARSGSASGKQDPDEEEIPENLAALFSGGAGGADSSRLVRLGDIADIYPGAAPRRPWCRRMAPPDESWRGVVGADAVDRFFVGKPSGYLLWNRFHLFRLPEAREYSVPEKVLLSRIGPPLAAAVDRSRTPAGGDVYSVVPKEGVSASFIACVLNSRLMDFYFNRLAARGASHASDAGGRLRIETLRAAPFPRPVEMVSQELQKAAALLSHFGPNPESWIDRQSRDGLWRQMEECVFAAFGAGHEAKNSLAALHF